jgi:NTE family protein
MSKKVSLVLSGGGARGLAHIGVIEELVKQGYDIHSVAGTSMGAIVGGLYAMGELDKYKEWMKSLDKMKVFSLVDFTFSAHGLIKGDKVLQKMQEFIPDQKIEKFPIYFTALATDIVNREEVVFDKGSFYEAIRASIAIPNVLKPVKKQHQLLVDGGVLNNLPLAYARREKGDLLVAVDVGASVPVIKPKLSKKEEKEQESVYQTKMKEFYHQLQKWLPSSNEEDTDNKEKEKEEKLGYFDLMSKTIDLMMEQQTKLIIENHPPDVLIQISRDSCGTYDFYRAQEMIEIGKLAFREQWKDKD